MTERDKIIAVFSNLHSSPDTLEEVMNMINKNKKYSGFTRKTVAAALAACLLLALGVTAYGAGKTIFGWGGNAEIRITENESGVSAETMLHTEDLTEPVIIDNGRMIFVVNSENIDITDKVSETEAFFYKYEDAAGVTHYIIVGLNSDELENYGYGEFMREAGQWVGGYSARTNLDTNGDVPAWLENAKAELNIPW